MWWNYKEKPRFIPEESRKMANNVVRDETMTVRQRVDKMCEGPHLAETLQMLADEIDKLKKGLK